MPDWKQPNVVNTITAKEGKNVTLEATGTCSYFSNVTTVENVKIVDPNYVYPYGFVDCLLKCSSPFVDTTNTNTIQSANVKIIWHV